MLWIAFQFFFPDRDAIPQDELRDVLGYHKRLARCAPLEVDSECSTARECCFVSGRRPA